MSGNSDKHPKTVNLDSSIPVNSQMKRVVNSICPNGPTNKCIKKSYNIPIAGKQANHWGKLNGMTQSQTCVGPINLISLGGGVGASGCITHYRGVSRCANYTPGSYGQCQISENATARGYWVTQNGNHGNIQNVSSLALHNSCPNNACKYLIAQFTYGNNNGVMTFSAVCNTCNK